MTRLAAVLLLAVQPVLAASPLAGTWLRDGEVYAELKADGSGTVAGDAVKWKTMGRSIVLMGGGGMQFVGYKLEGDKLTVEEDGRLVTLTRGAGKAKGAAAKPAKAAEAPKAAASGGRLADLLKSSAWCFFSYNKVSGTTRQSRVVFRGDGTWGSGSRHESYSSGMYGSVAGQTDSGDGGRWQAKGDRLLMSQGGGALEDVGLSVSKNSNGYPILKADGKEYSQCR